MAKKKKITFAEAAEAIAKKKAAIEKKIKAGDKWTENALKPQLQKLQEKEEELKAMNERARMEKAKKQLGKIDPNMLQQMVGQQEVPQEQSQPMSGPPFQQELRRGGYIPRYPDGGNLPKAEDGFDALMRQRGKDAMNQSSGERAANTTMEVAPLAWNAWNALRPLKDVPEYTNRYEKEAVGMIRQSTDFDFDPMREQVRIEQANNRKASRDAAMGSGYDYMRYNTALNRRAQVGQNQLLAQEQNMEAQMKQRAGQQLIGMGERNVQRDMFRDDLESRQEAGRRAFGSQFFQDVNKYSQRNQINDEQDIQNALLWEKYKTLGYKEQKEG